MALAELIRWPLIRSATPAEPPVRLRGVAAAHSSALTLSPIFVGARVLLIGPDAGLAAETAAFFGVKPTLHEGNEIAGALPYADSCFDVVELCEGPDDGPSPEYRAGEWAMARPTWLAECARVLRPGGALLLVTRTSGGYPLSRCVDQVLTAGLKVTGSWSLLPDSRAWKQMVPIALPAASPPPSLPRGPIRRAFSRKAAPRPDACYLLRALRPGGGAQRVPVMDEILARHGAAERPATISCRPYSGSLTCASAGGFIKVPLNPVVRAQTRTVCELFAEIEGHPIAEHLPLPLRQESVGAVEYFVARRISHEPAGRVPPVGALETVLEKLSVGARQIRLDDTDFWARVFSPQLAGPMGELGAEAALGHLTSLGGRQVACGLVHGDLHLYNVMEQCGRLFLIDWDQFERRSPRFLDVVDLSAALLGRDPLSRLRNPLLNPLRVIATGSRQIPFAQLLASEGASLLPAERVMLYLLHRASWRCINNPRLIPRDQEHFRRSLRRCVDLLAAGA